MVSVLDSFFERSRFQTWLSHFFVILHKADLLYQWLSPPSSMSGYQEIVREA